jgi:hypothetical protein
MHIYVYILFQEDCNEVIRWGLHEIGIQSLRVFLKGDSESDDLKEHETEQGLLTKYEKKKSDESTSCD